VTGLEPVSNGVVVAIPSSSFLCEPGECSLPHLVGICHCSLGWRSWLGFQVFRSSVVPYLLGTYFEAPIRIRIRRMSFVFPTIRGVGAGSDESQSGCLGSDCLSLCHDVKRVSVCM